ncbi:DUF3152 domain-containing protein [Streptomyces sp. NPDC101152]|uniref:DUF3152 domain-containing protein n=1 Tax=Streptomyces sp. NPDC101152 TaxID=3366116 RepID=UPI0038292500
MTAHKATRAGRRRRGGPAHALAGGRKGRLWGGVAAIAVLGAAGFAAVGWTSPGGGTDHAESAPGAPPARVGSPSPTPSPSSTPSSRHRPSASPSPEKIPATGPGTFTTASGTSAQVGTGKVLRYRVEVEEGLDLSAAAAAKEVERILADRRGWTADGHSAFQRVAGGTTDFVVKIATPGTVDKICGEYGLDTEGEVNCSVAHNVVVNLKRWLLATPVYAKDVTAYHALIINHEVGHFLGHGHAGCPGPGKPAPAMMQQIKGMHGCVPNVWPYDEQGRYITGPAVP